jgi:putative ABC transport system permease protein
MFLALREIRRALVRFGLLAAAIALLVFLILFQQALQDGLITSFVGGVRNQTAPVLVYSVDAQRTLQGSTIAPPLEQQIRATEGIGRAARIGQGAFTVRVHGGEERDAAIVGADDLDLVRPSNLTDGRRPEAAGEAVGSDVDFAVGDEVTVIPAPGAEPVVVAVVGVARDIQLSVTATLFTDLATYEAATLAANPDATAVLPNAIALEPASGVSAEQLAAAVTAAAPDAEALTRADAAAKSPGVAQVRQSFRVIFLLFALVVPLVTGLFFLIITLQKSRSLTLLRAIGARRSVLAGSVVFQVCIVIALGLGLGVAMYAPVSQLRVGGLALRFDLSSVIVWSVALLLLGLVGAYASLRLVLRIDPIEATTGGGGR